MHLLIKYISGITKKLKVACNKSHLFHVIRTTQTLNLMKTKNLTLSLTLFLSFLFSSSLTYGQTAGSGNVTQQNREVGTFTKIEAGSAFSLILEQGPETKVMVETDDNYQNKVETVVKGDRLTISSMGMQSPSVLKVWITSPAIVEISIYGAAKLSSTGTLMADQLKLELSGASRVTLMLDVQVLTSEISGAAKVTLSGSAIKHNAEISGAINLNAVELTTVTTAIELSGASKATINSTGHINAEITGASSLSYYDNGKLNRLSKSGSYEITPENPSERVAQTESDSETTISGDSTIIRIGSVSVEVHEGSATKVIIGERELEVDEDGNVKFKKNRQTSYNGHWAGVELGINGYVNNNGEFDMPENYEFLDLRMGKSINLKLNFYEQNFNLVANKLGFTTGLGLEWVNYRFDNNVEIRKDGNDIYGNYSYNHQTKSKLLVNYLNLPLMLEYQTNRHSKSNSFHIGAGIQTGLRIGAHTKRVIQDDDGNKKKDKTPGDYHINPFKFDAMVRVGWGKLNLHANYSLNTLFKNNRGPELYPFTVGITLASW